MSFLNSFVVVVVVAAVVVVVAFVNDVLLVGILFFFQLFLASIVAEVAAPPPPLPLRRELSICVFYCFYCLPMIELDERISVSGVCTVCAPLMEFLFGLTKILNHKNA